MGLGGDVRRLLPLSHLPPSSHLETSQDVNLTNHLRRPTANSLYALTYCGRSPTLFLSSSLLGMSTERERDFSSRFCLLCSSKPFTSWTPFVAVPPCPMSLFLVGTSWLLLSVRVMVLGSVEGLGSPTVHATLAVLREAPS